MPSVLFLIFKPEFYHQHNIPKNSCCSWYCSYRIGSSALTEKKRNFWTPHAHPSLLHLNVDKNKQVTTCSEDKGERWVVITETNKYNWKCQAENNFFYSCRHQCLKYTYPYYYDCIILNQHSNFFCIGISYFQTCRSGRFLFIPLYAKNSHFYRSLELDL